MIGKGVAFAAGAAAGVYATVRVRRAMEAFTPDGIRDRISAVGVGARMMRAEFLHGAAEAETDLRERYDLVAAQQATQHKQLGQSEQKRGIE
ncbi:hypothetical protein HNR19_002275 [Nocardioides thalensis]|uniref:Secreted protein n=1 Tax=Nocardioides thalensis TaxID=1914755 RepID=A0A853C315_9ACTN|nr:DUF6167 family protein [Nocardioides thalensis]NYJ01577.1 hypothetical protein [Nocardioides thalensis]